VLDLLERHDGVAGQCGLGRRRHRDEQRLGVVLVRWGRRAQLRRLPDRCGLPRWPLRAAHPRRVPRLPGAALAGDELHGPARPVLPGHEVVLPERGGVLRRPARAGLLRHPHAHAQPVRGGSVREGHRLRTRPDLRARRHPGPRDPRLRHRVLQDRRRLRGVPRRRLRARPRSLLLDERRPLLRLLRPRRLPLERRLLPDPQPARALLRAQLRRNRDVPARRAGLPGMTELLLVDDDAAFRDVYRELLSGEGYEVVTAGSAPEALARFEKGSARLVVLDLMLPPSGRAEEGAALSEKMLAARPATKIIVASGAGETPLALHLVQQGAYDFLAKPIDPDVLLAVVARAA